MNETPPREAATDSSGAEPARLETGAIVGRYVVLQQLGAGGMGVVYSCYDPELDRKIALKVLRADSGDGAGRARLLREAQALAKLSHPHVVAIHDVGTVGERVWLAMELIDGHTLRGWLETPRRWREVLEVMGAAGRGLSAAHAAGLSHRDFKPDNVMVGCDGRVRVMDFGLARASGKPTEPPTATTPPASTDGLVTREGAIVGTPRYMAPEQFRGREVTAAADQFAFCVTLWEAIYGEWPFVGKTTASLSTSASGGPHRSPSRRSVPSWLRQACERGLAVDPGRRWPSMEALLEALSQGQTRARRRRVVAAVGVLALLGAGVEGQRRYDAARRTEACEATGAELEVVWSTEHGEALREALVATRVGYAATTAERVIPRLDEQAREWRDARVEACLDVEVRAVWNADTLERSLWCLDERRMQLGSLVGELMRADEKVLQHAVKATMELPAVGPCRDAEALAKLAPPPAEHREAVRAVRADVTRAGSLQQAGRYEEGLELARGALARAEPLQWLPLTAAARGQVGMLLGELGEYEPAERALEGAFFEASRAATPEVAFRVALKLAFVVGYQRSRTAHGWHWAQLAELVLGELPDGDGLHRAFLLHHQANLHYANGAYDDARRLYEQALAIQERALGDDHVDVARALGNLANVHSTVDRFEEAKGLYERALVIQERALGPDHPTVAWSLGNLAVICSLLREYPRAKASFERALAIQEDALGRDHPAVADTLGNLAMVYRDIREPERAKDLLERALAIREQVSEPGDLIHAQILDNLARVLLDLGEREQARILAERALTDLEAVHGPDHQVVAKVLVTLGLAHRELGQLERALAVLERALAKLEKTLGPEHLEVARVLAAIALVLTDRGELARARALRERALRIEEAVLGADHEDLAILLQGLAELALAQGRAMDAVAHAERAVALRERGAVTRLLPEAWQVLARSLWDAPEGAGRDRARALALGRQARDALRTVGKPGQEELAVVDAWLAERSEE